MPLTKIRWGQQADGGENVIILPLDFVPLGMAAENAEYLSDDLSLSKKVT